MEDSARVGAVPGPNPRTHVGLLDELGSRAAKGDRDAFGQAYALLADDVYSFVRGQCRDDSAAEDLVAESFLRAWRFGPSFRSRTGNYRRWLFAIARNQVRDYWRLNRPTLGLDECEIASDIESASYEIRRQVVLLGLAALTDEQREAIVLRYFEGRDYGEIADLMGRRPGAIRALVMRGLRRMRRVVGDAAP